MEKLWSVFTKKQNSIGSAALVLVSMVFLSRVLGLVRDRLLSSYFGPEELGVYFAAFRIPNALFELLVMGALTSAFIPVYSRYIAKDDEKNAQILASSLINLSLVVFFFLAIPVFFGAEWVSRFMAPGFSLDQIRQMSAYTRFMILFQVGPLLVGNVFTGILQSHNLFLIPAAAPVLYNIGIIIGIILFSHTYGLWGAIIGVAIGALLFALIQIPLLIKVGYKHGFSVNVKHAGVREVGRLMGPRTFGLAISQIDTTIDLMMASLLGARMVTIFNFAQHLQQLPVGLFGTTIAQAALPSLSKVSATEDKDAFMRMIVNAIHQILFLVLPVSVLFIVLRIPVVRLVFGASQFDWAATVATGMTLSAFSISLFAQAIVQVLARAFYALYDSKTPVMIGIASVLVNSLLSILFVMYYKWPVWSLGVSASVASIVNALLLLYYLNRHVKGFISKMLLVPSLKMVLAALVTGVALYIPIKLLDQLVFDTTRTFGLLLLTGLTAFVGFSTYVFLSWVMGVEQVQSLLRLVRRVGNVRGMFLEPVQEVVSSGTNDPVS
ncbi:MAG: murein biosynthesis integral membrane protein MurJ [Patescibacteria group bacterium]